MMEKGKKNIQEGVCRICGCTEEDPCYNPAYGCCWWADETRTLCSHCAEEEIAKDPRTRHRVNSKEDIIQEDDDTVDIVYCVLSGKTNMEIWSMSDLRHELGLTSLDIEETLDELGKEFRIKERPASKDLEQVCDIIGWAMENRCDRMTLDKPSEGGQGTIIGTADNRGTNPATRSHPGR